MPQLIAVGLKRATLIELGVGREMRKGPKLLKLTEPRFNYILLNYVSGVFFQIWYENLKQWQPVAVE